MNDTDREAIEDAFDELEEAVRHLDDMAECTPLFDRVKQDMASDGSLDGDTRQAFIDRIIDLYVRARTAREDLQAALPETEGAELAAAREEADAYHRDTAALLNATSMLCLLDPGADRAALMERMEAAYQEHRD